MGTTAAHALKRLPEAELNQLTGTVIGAAIEVHRTLGPGFLESVYEEALCLELRRRGVGFVRQAGICVNYKGDSVGESRVDLLVEDCLVVELKAVETLAPIHAAQVVSYLKTTKARVGLLINFNVVRLRSGIKRIILD